MIEIMNSKETLQKILFFYCLSLDWVSSSDSLGLFSVIIVKK